MNDYYCYVLRRPDILYNGRSQQFYVGKCHNGRALQSTNIRQRIAKKYNVAVNTIRNAKKKHQIT